ncbi:MAG: bifunctional sulfate adenylyltransferase/adenylylsulfate kinase [Chloroflexi bacterium]|nr:bifunctional sulfate adenylyltransferase/adenylylsulfate kinase [Chloroflexota bacterium]MBP8058377.1 bifunctional sulfate adenylyltransferase/adenylylsulfate kinase [Chloroflexota bacterium]
MTVLTHQTHLITPYGGQLIDLLVPSTEVAILREHASHLPSLQLSRRAVCDLEMLAVGAFSPLDRFMGQADYQQVLDKMRLSNGILFPMPITLTVNHEDGFEVGQEIALRDSSNEILALMIVEEMYEWDREEVAQKVFGTQDSRHPLVAEMHRWGTCNISGPLRVIQLPRHYDFQNLRLTPAETRARLEMTGHKNVIAFQTRNPLHRVHEELTKRAIEEMDGVLLLHPVVGMTRPGDVDSYTRVRTYKALANRYYDQDRILFSLLPLAMRMGGPREALWHAIIRRNYGANHLIVGRDHAGPGNDSDGKPFYGPYDAQELVEAHSEEVGVKAVPFRMLVYLPDENRYEEVDKIAAETRTANISGTQVREEYLLNGRSLPEWFTRPEVAEILAEMNPPRYRQGVCVWLTGLVKAGKSTTAQILTILLQERGRNVTLLDGDIVRTHFSDELDFSKEGRDANVRRIGFVASEIIQHGGVVICAAVSPYRSTRNEVRNIVGSDHFVEVFVDAPLEVCENRDTKGLYAKARRGEIRGFTGIDDPYESPRHPDLHLDSVTVSAEINAHKILAYLMDQGFVREEVIHNQLA